MEIERFHRKFKLMRAHLPSRVLGTSSPLDPRLTVLVATIFSLLTMSFCQACGTKVFECSKYCHNCGAVADSFQNDKPEKTSLYIFKVHFERLFDGVFNLFVHSFGELKSELNVESLG